MHRPLDGGEQSLLSPGAQKSARCSCWLLPLKAHRVALTSGVGCKLRMPQDFFTEESKREGFMKVTYEIEQAPAGFHG